MADRAKWIENLKKERGGWCDVIADSYASSTAKSKAAEEVASIDYRIKKLQAELDWYGN